MAEGGKKSRERRFTGRMQFKLRIIFTAVVCLLGVLFVRIMVIAFASGNKYARQVLSQQDYYSQTIPYRRGEIMDRNGIILAKSDLVYYVVLDCRQVNTNQEYAEPTIRALVSLFDVDEERIRALLSAESTRDSQYQVIARNVTQEQKDTFEKYAAGTDSELTETQLEERSRIQGVWFEQQYMRNYPYDDLASNVLGFSHGSGKAIVGLEAYYDDLLTGSSGRIYGYLNSDQEYVRTTIEPEHGKTLVTTLDMNLQGIVEKHIQEFEEKYGDRRSRIKGAANVGVVVMNPKNGEILAMATNSPFDLNAPDDGLVRYFSDTQVDTFTDEEQGEELIRMWSNFCVSSSYEPGSVFKPVTVASALEQGSVKDEDHFVCDGYEYIIDTRINCDNIYGHGEETLEEAIVNSCNDALMQIGQKLGINAFCDYQQNFNFGSPTGIDLPDETAGVIYSNNSMHDVELATCTFGQGFTCSMIQEIAAFSAVINGGFYYQPHVLKRVQSEDGTVEKEVESLLLKQPVSSASSALLRRYLTRAVQEGTGQLSQVPGYLTGGKTGTAEKIDPKTGTRASGKYLVSFIGACPMDDPEVVIYVVIDEPNVEDQADSSYAQILFREIALDLFPALGLLPTEEITPDLLALLEMTERDIVRRSSSGGGRYSDFFSAFDSYGNLYDDCYVDASGAVMHGDGEEVAGAYMDGEGHAVDGYMNVIDVVLYEEGVGGESEEASPSNPDISAPPEASTAQPEDMTVWAGVTGEELEIN